MLKIILIIILTIFLVRLIAQNLFPWLIKKKFMDANSPFFQDQNKANNMKKKSSKYDGQGEYVDYEEVKKNPDEK